MIALVIVAAILALVVMVMLVRFSRRFAYPIRRPGRLSAHDEERKGAAAADVAMMEEDAKLISPDAPGIQEDDL